ncbi:MAG: hypothetical protein J7642_21420 [Cyanobacteria bacterium SBC]|nr:hypothetical protein [Cyanobacteria bacterium SBC]
MQTLTAPQQTFCVGTISIVWHGDQSGYTRDSTTGTTRKFRVDSNRTPVFDPPHHNFHADAHTLAVEQTLWAIPSDQDEF